MRFALAGLLALTGCAGTCGQLGNNPIGSSRTLPIGDSSVGPRGGATGCVFPANSLLAFRAANVDGAGGNPGDGNPVDTWADLGSRGADATASGTARPTYQSDCGNGKPCLDFTSVQRMDTPTFSALPSTWTVCAVLAPRVTSATNAVFVSETTAGTTFFAKSTSSLYQLYVGTGGPSESTGSASNKIDLFCGYYTGTSGSLARVNGNETSGSTGSTTVDDLKIGAWYNNTLPYNGHILDLAFWEGDQTAAFESWAACEYGSFPGALAMPSGAEYLLDARDLDGDGSFNSAYSSGDKVATFSNQGATSGDCIQATTANQPVAVKTSGEDWLSFDGVSDRCEVASSAAGTGFIHSSGIFDMFLCFRPDRSNGTENVLVTATGGVESGFYLRHLAADTLRFRVFNAGASVVDKTTTFTIADGTHECIEIRGNGATLGISSDLESFETAVIGTTGSGSASNDLAIGAAGPGNNPADAAVYFLALYDSQLDDQQQLQARRYIEDRFSTQPTRVAVIGDSIALGSDSHTDVPAAVKLEAIAGVAVGNYGISGDTSAECLTNWTNNASGDGHAVVFVHCGVNSALAGTTDADWSSVASILSSARGAGQSAYVDQIFPFKGYSGWSAGDQAEAESFNASALSDVGTAALYADYEGAADTLHVSFDSGDGLHPDDDGHSQMAADWKAAAGL